MTCSPRLTLSPLVAALVLAGCATDSLFESRKIDYKNAHPTSTLEVPPDLTAPTRNDRFAVPDVSPRGTATFSDYKAERVEQSNRGDIEVLPASAQMRIERAGSQRWLVVPGTPGNIWPQIRDFWLELGFILNIDSPEIGVLETDWAENRANIPQDFLRSLLGRVIDGLYSTPERDKFRTRIEAGKDGTVEIYISHRGMLEVYTSETAREGTTVWQPRPADPELEAEMLRRLMVRLGADETHAQAVLASAPQVERAQLQETDGQTRLRVDEPFDRSWRRVGLALDRVGFTVEDRDRAKGIYFVRYIDPEVDNDTSQEGGFFSKLLFWRSKEKAVASGGEYRILLADRGEDVLVSVLTREGGADSSPTARKILELLHKELR